MSLRFQYPGRPMPVQRRIKALKNLQKEKFELQTKFYEELHLLKAKYEQQFAPLFVKRYQIVSAAVEPTDDECNWSSGEEEEEEVDTLAEGLEKGAVNETTEISDSLDNSPVKGIPNFWLQIFENVGTLADMMQPCDELIIKHLIDIRLKKAVSPLSSFTLEFVFEPNDYFTDDILTKEYILKFGLDSDEPLNYVGPKIVKCKGCKIHWKPGKDVTKKKVKTVANESFFNFFSPPEVTEGVELDKDVKEILLNDFDAGQFLREKVIPEALLYFTGDAQKNNDEDDVSMELKNLPQDTHQLHSNSNEQHSEIKICGLTVDNKDDCLHAVLEFIQQRLKISDIEESDIESAYTLPKETSASRSADGNQLAPSSCDPVIVRFVKRCQLDTVVRAHERMAFETALLKVIPIHVIWNSRGQTSAGQDYMIVINRIMWYKVRLFLAEDHLENDRKLTEYHSSAHGPYEDAMAKAKWIQKRLQRTPLLKFTDIKSKDWKYYFSIVKLPNDCKEHPDEYLRRGDHVQITRKGGMYTHDAIYLGNKLVIHIFNDDGKKDSASAREDSWSNFIGAREDGSFSWFGTVFVVVYRLRIRTVEEIVNIARDLASKFYGKGDYNFFSKNCQHFASFCSMGKELSFSVKYLERKFDPDYKAERGYPLDWEP